MFYNLERLNKYFGISARKMLFQLYLRTPTDVLYLLCEAGLARMLLLSATFKPEKSFAQQQQMLQ